MTVASGLGEPISTESSAWGDYDNDGWVDLFVCGEFHAERRPDADPERCRLYHNQDDGTFKDVAETAGVINERYAKGSAWGDYDGDGRLDLFVSNMGEPARLYHNEGNGKFRDVARELGVPGGHFSFSCWFWDYDNDGWLDLFVNDYPGSLAGRGRPLHGHPGERLGASAALPQSRGPRDSATSGAEVGLDWPIPAMGATSATSTTTAISTPTSGPAGCPTRIWCPT